MRAANVIGASKIARDITENGAHEERRQLLVNELNHRVKNTLATVQSLATQTFRGEGHNPAVRQFESKIVALSRAHDSLTREDWEGHPSSGLDPRCDLPDLRSTPSNASELLVPDVRLRPKLALSLSMAFHELCTNAAKYGALTKETGRIQISWEIRQADPESCLRLRWEEMGGPKVVAPRQKGFGRRLLERALHREFDAQVTLSFAPSGLVCEIHVTLT